MVTPKSERDINKGSAKSELSSLMVRRLPSVARISFDTGDCACSELVIVALPPSEE